MAKVKWFGFCFVAAAAMTLAGCDSGKRDKSGMSDLEGKVTVDGSSTVEPISTAVAKAFMEKHGKVDVTVGTSGTGGGFKRFQEGETDVSDASRPIKAGEFESCKANGVEFIEIPVAYDGLSIVVNKKNKFATELTIDDLKKIFLAPGAKTWREVNADWPAEEIKVYAPGKDSGTYDYFFSDVVAKKEGTPRSEDISFNEDDNVLVDGVKGDEFAIAFFGCSYYFENEADLTACTIVDPVTGKAVAPTPETIESGEYSPFSRPLFIYVNTKSLESPATKAFVEFYLEKAGDLSESVRYVRLPDEIYDAALTHYENRLAGTHYLTAEMEKREGSLAEVYKKTNLVNTVEK